MRAVLHPGDVVGQTYRVVRLIGSGGMGEVYEALHEPLSRRVAIKTIRPDLAGTPELVTRFRREAEASVALGHPNIVQVTDFVIDGDRPPVIVMELLEGRTLRDLMLAARKLEPPRAVFIALQILAGLSAAHRAGIIHRDVKPGNVFLQKTLAVRDHVKLLDFGVAKLLEHADSVNGSAPVTQRGIVLGTKAYMAPEQERGGPVDARSDLYAVAATLYYALSGWKPRDTDAPKQPLPLRRVAPDVPAALAAIVDQAISLEPRDRYPSAESMGEALSAFSETTGGFGLATISPGMPVPAEGTAVTATTEGPMTERDLRFSTDVLASDQMRTVNASHPPPDYMGLRPSERTEVDPPTEVRSTSEIHQLTTKRMEKRIRSSNPGETTTGGEAIASLAGEPSNPDLRAGFAEPTRPAARTTTVVRRPVASNRVQLILLVIAFVLLLAGALGLASLRD
jgi:serine/threonine protein kinase